jgi:hypothetical protein
VIFASRFAKAAQLKVAIKSDKTRIFENKRIFKPPGIE